MRTILIITLSLQWILSIAQTQQETLPPTHIKSITLQELYSESTKPIVALNKTIALSFDDLNGDEADYYYTVTHCNFDWTASDLQKTDYLKGMDEQYLQTYTNSFNTLQIYSHYKLQIPNSNVRITKTGNYLISIYNDNDDLVFSKKCIVYQQKSNISTQIKRSRDLAFSKEKQIVQFSVTPQNGYFTNPKQTVQTVVFKNNTLSESITTLKPQYTIGNKLIYKYDQEAAFWAGNEYLYFDNKNIRGGSITIQRFKLDSLYHNYLYTNLSRRNTPYTYNPDANGKHVIRNLHSSNHNIEADYVLVHFSLENYANLKDRKIYVVGDFNNHACNSDSELIYNPDNGIFENTSLIKQGFVNYQFITHTNNTIDYSFIDGNYHQTENDFTIVVYYRALGTRYDSVIGIGQGNSINISN